MAVQTLPTAADFEKEALQASNLYVTAQSLRDKGDAHSMAKVTTAQFLDLDKEKTQLEKELKDLKNQLSAYERDFLDQRSETGDVITTMPGTLTLQDSALSLFAGSWILFAMCLIAFAFLPPFGTITTGIRTLLGVLFTSVILWGLIYNYA
jgi:hypothetical protein